MARRNLFHDLELACRSRRIILLLDIAATYEQLRSKRNRIYREICGELGPTLHKAGMRRAGAQAA